MNIEQVREYTLSLPGVTEDQAFGEDILNFRLEGKIFVCLWLGGGKHDMQDSEPKLIPTKMRTVVVPEKILIEITIGYNRNKRNEYQIRNSKRLS